MTDIKPYLNQRMTPLSVLSKLRIQENRNGFESKYTKEFIFDRSMLRKLLKKNTDRKLNVAHQIFFLPQILSTKYLGIQEKHIKLM